MADTIINDVRWLETPRRAFYAGEDDYHYAEGQYYTVAYYLDEKGNRCVGKGSCIGIHEDLMEEWKEAGDNSLLFAF